VVVHGDGGVEYPVAVRGDAVEPGPWDFGDEAVAAQLDDEAGHSLAATVGFFDAVGRSGVEPCRDVVVAEPGDGVLACEHGPEQGEIGPVEGLEPCDVAAMVGSGSAQGVEGGDAFAVGCGAGEGVEVAAVGAGPDLEVAPRVGHALSHFAPPPRAAPVVVFEEAQDAELARIVDGGLDAQHGGLVVDLDPVAGQPMLDPPALGARLASVRTSALSAGWSLRPRNRSTSVEDWLTLA
jgi:hypothetical protein